MSETGTLESDPQMEVDNLTDVEEFEAETRHQESCPPLKPVEALRDEQTQLEAWVHQSFAALERLHSELDQWQRELTKQQVNLDESLANGHNSSEQVLQLEQAQDRIVQERDQALQEIRQLEKALAQSQASLAENDSSRHDSIEQLEQLQQQCDLAKQQLAQAHQEVRQLEEENGEQVQELDELDRQFTAVQAELKAVREHAEQLSQSLESDRQRAAEQQHGSSELKDRRHLLDRQCELMVRGSADGALQAPVGPESMVPEQTAESQVMEGDVSVAVSAPLNAEAKRSDEIRRRAKNRRAAKRRKRKLPE